MAGGKTWNSLLFNDGDKGGKKGDRLNVQSPLQAAADGRVPQFVWQL